MFALSRAKIFSACLGLAVAATIGCGKREGGSKTAAADDGRHALTGTVISLSAERARPWSITRRSPALCRA
jgi:hypothetical protein